MQIIILIDIQFVVFCIEHKPSFCAILVKDMLANHYE
jgi:hypothetical protein